MGEEGETIKFYSRKDTSVFWNLDDYPTPVGIDDLGFIRINIEEALHQFGFHGDNEDINVQTYMTLAAVDKVTTLDLTSILVKFAFTALDINLAVIAKPKPELARVLKCLASRGHTILLIVPPDEECSFTVESLLRYAHLVLGASDTCMVKEEEEGKQDSSHHVEEDLSQGEKGKQVLSQGKEDLSQGEEDTSDVEEDPYNYYYPSDVEEDPFDVEEDHSKILDFLEPIRPVKGDMTAVFWDAQDCPFPLGSTPDEIYHSIASALVEREFTDKITIWAYLGDKDSRRIRMANDILFLKAAASPKSLILVSDQFEADLYYLELLYRSRLNILFIIPTQDNNKPESPEWPRLLLDKARVLTNITILLRESVKPMQRLNGQQNC
ncbi:hypothetical protein Bca4012_025374 [Brassica carinata]